MTEISKRFTFTGLICFMNFLIFCQRHSIVGVFRVLFLYDFPCQSMRQNVPLTTLPQLLPSEVQQFLSCVNSLIPTEVLFLRKDFSMVITFLPTMSSLTVCDLWSPDRVYLSTKGFPSLCVYTVCLSIHSPATGWSIHFNFCTQCELRIKVLFKKK